LLVVVAQGGLAVAVLADIVLITHLLLQHQVQNYLVVVVLLNLHLTQLLALHIL